MSTLLSDLRFALRQLRSSPGFAAAAVLSLGLGIGATTAIFSVGNALLRQEIHAAQPDRLARVYRNQHSPLSHAQIRHLQENAGRLGEVLAERPMDLGLRVDGRTEPLPAALVTGNFFSALGVDAALGRVFSYDPAREAAAPAAVVLTHDYWRSAFGGDPSVVGSTIRLNDQPFTVVGVAEEGFRSSQLLWAPRAFVPLGQLGPLTGTSLDEWQGTMYVTGRLAPGADVASADAEAKGLWERMRQEGLVGDERTTVRVAHARGVTAEARLPLTVGVGLLLGAVGLVLLIACANVANLLLARATTRRREIAARLAIGASRGRLVRQLLTESLVLAALGGALGYAVAASTTDLIWRFLPEQIPLLIDLSPDGTVLLFTGALCVLVAVLFGLVPALQASSPELVPALKEGRGGSGVTRSRTRDAFLVAQVALCMVTLATAGLFARSLQEAREMDPGFDARGVLDVDLNVEPAGMDAGQAGRFYVELLERTEAHPAVASATVARIVPLAGSNSGGVLIRPGVDEADPRSAPPTYKNLVGPEYFETLEIPIVRGRGFTARDDAGAPPVVVLNETAAQRLWPGEEALGRRVALDDPAGPYAEVIGIAADAKYNTPGEAPLTFAYFPILQMHRPDVVLQVRAAGPVPVAREALDVILDGVDPRIVVGAVRPMTEDVAITLIPARVGASLLGIFGVMALLIAAVGIYGVTSYVVAQRTREIGIRTALGAERGHVLRFVVGGTFRRVAVGLGLGLVLAVVVGRLVSSLLYGVGAADPAVTLVTPMVLAAVALAATYLPARRAAGTNPMVVLRGE